MFEAKRKIERGDRVISLCENLHHYKRKGTVIDISRDGRIKIQLDPTVVWNGVEWCITRKYRILKWRQKI